MNRILLGLLVFAAASLAAMAQVPKNPWIRFQPGSWAKVESTSEVELGGQKSTIKAEAKTTLISKTDSSVTIETETTSMGKTTKLSREILIDDEELGPKPVAPPKYGNETITAAGRSFSCVTVEYRTIANDVTSDFKEWISEEVPGGVVKSETVSTLDQTRTRTTVILTDFQSR